MINDNTAQLIDRAGSGDQQAFGILVSRYAATVTGVALSVCGDFAQSEDIGQEAFIEAWRRLATLRDPEKFVAWICTIARRRAIDTLRRDKTSRSACSIDGVPAELSDPKQQAPETNMAQQQDREMVWSLLEGLPEQYREAMVLFYRAEQSTRDVAIALGENEPTIRQRLKRGREMLREDVTESIRKTLCETAPKAAFTMLVLASLPSATYAAGATATATTATVTGKSAGTGTLAVTTATGGAVFGSLLGLLGGVFGTWMSWKNCEYESQQRFIIRQTKLFVTGMAVASTLFAALMYARLNGFLDNNVAYGCLLFGLILGFQAVNFVWMWRGIKGYKQLGETAKANGEPMRESVRLQMENVRRQTRNVHSDGSVSYEAFRWNAGAWGGTCFGTLAWMVPLSFITFRNGSVATGSIAAICCTVGAAVAAVMWRARNHFPAYTGIQMWVGVAGVLTVVVFCAVQFLTNHATQEALNWKSWFWLLLLLFPILSFQFHNTRRSFERNMQTQDEAMSSTDQ